MPAPVFAPNSNNLVLGKGELFFDRYTSAPLKNGMMHLGNVETFEITTEDDSIEKKSSMSSATPILKKVSRGRTVTMKVAGNDFAQDTIALALMGENAEVTQTATPVVAEIIGLAASVLKGRYYRITGRYGPFTAVVIKQGATTLVLNTDYTLDAANGIVGAMQSSPTIVNGVGNLTADYTPTVYSAGAGIQTIKGGNKSLIEGGFFFKPDPASGPKMSVHVFRVSISPDAAMGFISDDFASWGLSATVLDDSAGLFGGSVTEPLYRVSYLP
jgi:hypothetical protein